MAVERDGYYHKGHPLHEKCKKHMYYHVILTMKDGSTLDGIIGDVDADHITMLVGEDVVERENQMHQGCNRDYSYNYIYPMNRYRIFRPQTFPLASLAALSLLPYPYIAPPYPYPYQYPYPYPYSYPFY